MGRRRGKERITDQDQPIASDTSDAVLNALGLTGAEFNAPGKSSELAVDDIWPDPVQPRRAMPEGLRAQWVAGEPVESLLTTWSRTAKKDFAAHGLDNDWTIWLVPPETGTPLDNAKDLPFTPSTRSWIALLRLAASIYQNGLEVPISVYPTGADSYRVLVGERRILAFHLLGKFFEQQGYERIPALVRDRYDPVRQALENGARKNLNAIATARQLALLLMVLNGIDAAADVQPNRTFYASAADLRVPYGKGDAVAHALGLSSARMVRLYRRLLTLPDVVWTWADQFDWPEGKIRTWLAKAGNDDNILISLANAEAQREMGEKPDLPTEPPAVTAQKTVKRAVTGLRSALRLDGRTARHISDEDKAALLDAAEAIIQRFG